MWNSSARIELNDHKDPNEKGEYVTRGNVTEQGIMKFFMSVEGGAECLKVKHELSDDTLLQVISFSSSRKRASVVVKKEDGSVRVYTKGAPDMLFEKLAGVQNIEGNVVEMEDDSTAPEELGGGEHSQLEILEKTVKYFADQAYRTILVCYRDMSMDAYL